MKIRNGFVSNSSSSSFMIVVKQEDHKQALEAMHPYYKAWFADWGDTRQKLFGEDVHVFNMYICSEDEEPIASYKGEYPPEAEDYFGDGQKMVRANDVVYEYKEILKSIGADFLYESMSM